VKPRYRSARDLLAEIQQALDAKPAPRAATPLDKTVELLYQHRGYFWIGIYLVVGEKVVRQTFRGPVPPCHEFAFGKGNVGTTGQTGLVKVIPDVSEDPTYSMCFIQTKSEIVVPIKIAGRTLGVIDVESDRVNAFGPADRVLLKTVAMKLARYLTSKGKWLVRRAREKQAAAETAKQEKGIQPKSERPDNIRRAAAGEKSR
jgi:L-methionine (R)-S-oxide reductase